ncbi:MAG TPA: ATP-grasp domain-containing protein [Thiobacillaceae bacterium]|nr:ATP-grasp domain-containing protein [Thiobacillaceae bacterium]HNA81410.1 ATP-grasp domain-containing protein [Thiobacillaceae bacterium]HNF88029.1 ATP-grasp domain-containing protein [Thiobacillaceae bacterium]HNH89321.1 ATP-grasp domain-containing protein [Thiobacillaceae bacterium]HNI07057.1 ATP-grasp domain-containing protein [Thiobacillaceae bacterium]
MKVFVFEFVTGGGCAGGPLPGYLADGELMWRALVDDLIALPGVEVVTLRDGRLERPALERVDIVATGRDGFDRDFRRCLDESDAVWTVAPESGGVLEWLNRAVLGAGKRLLGCGPESVRIAASKTATYACLADFGVEAIPTYTSPYLIEEECPVVMKPDDGAGCQDTRLFACLADAESWSRMHTAPGCIYQPYVPGEPLSLSLLCAGGRAQLLAVNRQRVVSRNGSLGFQGVTVNAVADTAGRYADLGERVAAAMPGLWGHVGVDVIEAAGGLPVVVEVNPRPTVSYAGLRAALDRNPAELVLELPEFGPCQPRRTVHLESRHGH